MKQMSAKYIYNIVLVILLIGLAGCKQGDLSVSSNHSAPPATDNSLPLNSDDPSKSESLPLNGDDPSNSKSLPLDGDDPSNTSKPEKAEYDIVLENEYEKQKVDILLVIDNSGSTTGERALLQQQGLLTPENDPGSYTISRARAARFGDIFNTTLKYADWQMGFTSFPHGNNYLYTLKDSPSNKIKEDSGDPITILTPDLEGTYELETIFKETVVSRQFGASGTEVQGLHNWINTEHPDKEKFIRDDALFVVLFIADSDDHSNIDPDVVLLDIEENFGSEKLEKFVVYGITTKPNDDTCIGLSTSWWAEAIEYLALITGGLTHSICDLNYESVMTKLGEHLTNKVLKDFHIKLKHKNVVPGSIKLSANAPKKFTYDAKTNTLSFFQVPSGDLTITISYDYL